MADADPADGYSELSAKQLKQECKDAGLYASGRKDEMIARLRDQHTRKQQQSPHQGEPLAIRSHHHQVSTPNVSDLPETLDIGVLTILHRMPAIMIPCPSVGQP